MVRYELQKLLQKRMLQIFLFLLFLANAALAYKQEAAGSGYGYGAREIQTLYAALPSEPQVALAALEQQLEVLYEEAPTALITQDIYTERQLFRAVTERVADAANYKAYLQSVEDNAQALLAAGLFDEKNAFGYQNVITSQEVFRRLEGVEPEVFYSGALELLPNARLTDGISLLLCLLLGLELIVSERTGGTMALIKPTKEGRAPLLRAKLFTCATVLFAGVFLLYGTNLAVGILRCGSFPLDAPVQSIFGFQTSAWRISIGGYLLLFFLLKYLWCLAVCALVLLLCYLANSSISACALVLAAVLPSLLTASNTQLLGSLSLVNAADTQRFFTEYRNLNLGGSPVSTFTVSTLWLISLCALCLCLLFLLHRHRSPSVSTRKRCRKTRRLRISVSLLHHEGYKLWIKNGALAILLAFLALQLYSYHSFDERISTDDRIYMQYSAKLEGKADAQKDAYIQEESQRFADLYTQLEELSSANIDQQTYEALYAGIRQKLYIEPIFARASAQYFSMKAQDNDYVCLVGYDRLLGDKGQQDMLLQSVKLAILLILGLASVFAAEEESKMSLLLNTTTGKKRSYVCRIGLSALYAVFGAVAAYLPQVLVIGKTYGLSGLDSTAGSVPALHIRFGTVLSSLCLYALGGIAFSLAAAALVLFLSKRSGSTVQTVLFSSALLLLPLLALYLLHML